jgi:hypothetical protein
MMCKINSCTEGCTQVECVRASLRFTTHSLLADLDQPDGRDIVAPEPASWGEAQAHKSEQGITNTFQRIWTDFYGDLDLAGEYKSENSYLIILRKG